jgi:hypothetical protein
VAAAISAAPGCAKKSRNLPFGATCEQDRDRGSGICLFPSESARSGGWCTRPCDGEKNDCEQGKACVALAHHAGQDNVLVCGEPPPIPLGGPGGPPLPPASAGTAAGLPETRPPEKRPPGKTPGP